MRKEPFLIAFSLCFYLAGHYALVRKFEPSIFFFYVISWWSYIIFLDSLLSWRSGKYTFLNKELPFTIVVSCAFWCSFELINLLLANWFYVNLPDGMLLRYTGYLLAYGTVIPAITLTASALHPFFRSVRIVPFTIKNYPSRAISLGIVLFLLTIVFPKYLFPLAWAFAIPLVDGINYRNGFRSFMADIERGDISRFVSALLSGLVCGVIWETWNYLSPVRWIYTVPFFENLKIFEMPLPGYIGFLVFGVETVAFMDLFQGAKGRKIAIVSLISCAIAVCALAFPLIDRYTAFSYAAPIERLSFLTERSKAILRGQGVSTNLGISPETLDTGARNAIDLIGLKGLGYQNYLRLTGHGITRIEDLNNIDETTLSQVLKEDNLRRVRVYLRAAREH